MLLLYFLNLRVPGAKPGVTPKEEPIGGNKEEPVAPKEEQAKPKEEEVKLVENVKPVEEGPAKGKDGKAYEKGETKATSDDSNLLIKEVPEWKGPCDYSNIKNSRFKIGKGKNFSPAQKEAIYNANKAHNDGYLRSDLDGTVLEKPVKSESGVTPSQNEAQVDHIQPKSKGGTNSIDNAKVLSRKQNRAKSDTWDD